MQTLFLHFMFSRDVRVFVLRVLIFPLLIYFPGVSLFFSEINSTLKERNAPLKGPGYEIQFKKVDKNR
jgi:hypothetical protein